MSTARIRRRDIVYRRPRQRLTVVEQPAQKKRSKEQKRRIFFLAAFFCGLLIINLSVHAVIAQNGFKIQKTAQAIDKEIKDGQRLKLVITSLENPSRIREIAVKKIGMCQPASVTFLSLSSLKNGSFTKKGSELARVGPTSIPQVNRVR